MPRRYGYDYPPTTEGLQGLQITQILVCLASLAYFLHAALDWSQLGRFRRVTTEMRVQSGIDDVLRQEGLSGGLTELRAIVRGELGQLGKSPPHRHPASRITPPDPYAEARWATMEDQLAGADDRYVVIGNGFTLWERAFYLHGYEAMLADFYLAPDRVHELLDRILDFHVRPQDRFLVLQNELVEPRVLNEDLVADPSVVQDVPPKPWPDGARDAVAIEQLAEILGLDGNRAGDGDLRI